MALAQTSEMTVRWNGFRVIWPYALLAMHFDSHRWITLLLRLALWSVKLLPSRRTSCVRMLLNHQLLNQKQTMCCVLSETSMATNHPVPVIKETLHDFFHEDEILQANEALMHGANNLSVSTKSFYETRIENKVKTSIDDITSIIMVSCWRSWLDRSTANLLYTVNSSGIPLLPQEMSDMEFLRKSVSNVCHQIPELQSQVAGLLRCLDI